MRYRDAVYGEQIIDDPLVIELIESPSLQRLRGVDQAGYPRPFRPNEETHSRFDHSVGVYLLLRQFGAPFEEQISGLIHDVSHTAFSHCMDYTGDVRAQISQSFQDDIFEEFVSKSEIPQIVQRYGIDIKNLLDDARFPLKEKSLPDLCADRIDYSLRSAVLVKHPEVPFFLENLQVIDGNWVFKNRHAAERYASLFSWLNKKYYSSITSVSMFYCVGTCLRYAVDRKYINSDDLFATDEHVLQKIRSYLGEDQELLRLYRRMHNEETICHDPDNFEAKVFCKSRVVDPSFCEDGHIKRLSEVDKDWGTRIQVESGPRSYCLRFSPKDQELQAKVRL